MDGLLSYFFNVAAVVTCVTLLAAGLLKQPLWRVMIGMVAVTFLGVTAHLGLVIGAPAYAVPSVSAITALFLVPVIILAAAIGRLVALFFGRMA